MANEIRGYTSLAIASGPRRAFMGVNFGLTLTSDEIVLQDQSVGTAAEALDFGDVVPTVVAIVNQDTTNYVQLGLDSGVSTKIFARLAPGRFALWMPYTPADTIYAKANSSACKCAVLGIEGAALGSVEYQATPVISGSYNATAMLSISGSNSGGTVSIGLSATCGWNAVGAASDDSLIPFQYREQVGAGVGLPAASETTSAGGFVFCVNAGDSEDPDSYLSLVNDGSDKVAKLVVGGGFAALPLGPSKVLYIGEADSVNIPLFVSY